MGTTFAGCNEKKGCQQTLRGSPNRRRSRSQLIFAQGKRLNWLLRDFIDAPTRSNNADEETRTRTTMTAGAIGNQGHPSPFPVFKQING
jgi:hypothetical protein